MFHKHSDNIITKTFPGCNRQFVLTDITLAPDDVFIAAQLFKAHGTPGMEFLSGDTNLAAKTKFTAVGEPGAGIDIDRGAVHETYKTADIVFIPGNDTVAVVGGVVCNVADRGVYIIHDPDGQI